MNARRLARSGEQIVEEDLALAAIEGRADDARFTPRERAALMLADQMCIDHNAVSDGQWAELTQVFTTEEIVDLGLQLAQFIGMGKLMAMLRIPAVGYRGHLDDYIEES